MCGGGGGGGGGVWLVHAGCAWRPYAGASRCSEGQGTGKLGGLLCEHATLAHVTVSCLRVLTDEVPSFLRTETQYEDLFISPARLIVRQPGKWYEPST